MRVKRIISVLAAMAIMATMMVFSAVPAFAQENLCEIILPGSEAEVKDDKTECQRDEASLEHKDDKIEFTSPFLSQEGKEDKFEQKSTFFGSCEEKEDKPEEEGCF